MTTTDLQFKHVQNNSLAKYLESYVQSVEFRKFMNHQPEKSSKRNNECKKGFIIYIYTR